MFPKITDRNASLFSLASMLEPKLRLCWNAGVAPISTGGPTSKGTIPKIKRGSLDLLRDGNSTSMPQEQSSNSEAFVELGRQPLAI
jgi:hypothetical protein